MADLGAAGQRRLVGDDARVGSAGHVEGTRLDPRGDDEFVEAVGQQLRRTHAAAGDDPGAEITELGRIGAHDVGIVGLARDAGGEVHLPADARAGFEHHHLVPARGGLDGADEAGNAGAHHCDLLPARNRLRNELGFACGARVDKAGDLLALEIVVKTGLVAGNARGDAVGASGKGFVGKGGVREQRTRHRDHVARAVRDQALGKLR